MKLRLSKTGQTVWVDDEDVHLCRSMQMGRDEIIYVRWCENRKRVRKALHRVIMGEPKGFEVDHKNGNRFDNRKANLRICTPSQNTCNRDRPKRKLQHKYRGTWHFAKSVGRKLEKPWVARIKIQGKAIYGGYFRTAKEAALAYDQLARKHHGEFARLNFPNEGA